MTEIKRLKSALLQYRLSRFLPKKWFKTTHGFCYHFTMSTKGFPPTLEKLEVSYDERYTYNVCYWFKPGDIKSRIALLKQAIKLCDA